MSKAILMISSLVLSGAFSHDAKSAQKVQTTDLGLDESAGEDCSSSWDWCGGGLSCSTTTKTCVPYATRNEACGDSAGGIDCVDNYWCLLGIGSGYTCSSGAQGDACSKQNLPHSCNGDLSCLSNGMCGTNAGPGDVCGSSAGNVDCVAGYWCSEGIGSGKTCSSGKEGEACSTLGESCNSGLSCLSKGYCGKNAGPKEACGKSAGNVDCGSGYWCSEGIGSGYTCSSGKKGEACSNFGESCNSGLSCLSDGMCGFAIGGNQYCCNYWAKADNFCTNAGGVKASDPEQVCGCTLDFMTFLDNCNAAVCTSGKKCQWNETLPYVAKSKESFWDKALDDLEEVVDGIAEGVESVAVGLFDTVEEVGECVWDIATEKISGTDACDKLGTQLKDMLVDVGKCWLAAQPIEMIKEELQDPSKGLFSPITQCPLYGDLVKAWKGCVGKKGPITCMAKYTTIVALQVVLAVATGGTSAAAEATGDAVVGTDEVGTVGGETSDVVLPANGDDSGCRRRHRRLLACKDANCRAEVRETHRKLPEVSGQTCSVSVDQKLHNKVKEIIEDMDIDKDNDSDDDGFDDFFNENMEAFKKQNEEKVIEKRNQLKQDDDGFDDMFNDNTEAIKEQREDKVIEKRNQLKQVKPKKTGLSIIDEEKEGEDTDTDSVVDDGGKQRASDVDSNKNGIPTVEVYHEDEVNSDSDSDSGVEGAKSSNSDSGDEVDSDSDSDSGVEGAKSSNSDSGDEVAVGQTNLTLFQRFLQSIRDFLNLFKRTQRLSDDDPDKVNDKDSAVGAQLPEVLAKRNDIDKHLRRLAVHEMDKGELTIDELLLLNDIFGAFGSGMSQVSNYYSADRLRDLNTKLSLNGQKSGLEFTTYANPGNYAYSGVNELGSETASKIVLKAVELPGNAGKMILTASKTAASPLSGTPRPAVLATSNSTQD